MALVCISDYEQETVKLLSKNAWEFFRSGAGNERTLQLNCDAFNKIRIRPRVLIDISKRDLSCQLLGIDLDFPIAIAPTSAHRVAHSDGEIATAKAAEKLNTIYTMSMNSTRSMEEVSVAAPKCNKWCQLHFLKDREIMKSMIRRAEKNGFKAIVVTVDSQVHGTRSNEQRYRLVFPDHFQFPFIDGIKSKSTGEKNKTNETIFKYFDATSNWNDVQWLVNFTHLPVILKGILTHEDATLALKSGCKGIIVSNHGARQLDTVPATLEALPEIVNAVGSQMTVMFDGGIRNGTDVFKALALGAKCVFIGRPIIYGLAVNGQQGVEDVLEILKNEFDTTMALAGVRKLSEINENYVAYESTYKMLSSKL